MAEGNPSISRDLGASIGNYSRTSLARSDLASERSAAGGVPPTPPPHFSRAKIKTPPVPGHQSFLQHHTVVTNELSRADHLDVVSDVETIESALRTCVQLIRLQSSAIADLQSEVAWCRNQLANSKIRQVSDIAFTVMKQQEQLESMRGTPGAGPGAAAAGGGAVGPSPTSEGMLLDLVRAVQRDISMLLQRVTYLEDQIRK